MANDSNLHYSRSFQDDRLAELESQWLRNQPPDIASYLLTASSADAEFLHDLVEIDLECRWKRYRGTMEPAEMDPQGFPRLPRLEHYAKLLPEDRRHLILTPQLLAEEYRVRRKWGDQPDRREYLQRLPLDPVAVESALDQIDTEFEVERQTPLDQQESSQLADESTWLVNQPQATEVEAAPILPLNSVGKYQIESLLGKGGFGEVWKAYDPHLKRYVALKIPRRDRQFTRPMLESFRVEAQQMATLDRVPGIVPVYEAGEIDEQPYIISLLVQGEDLGKRSQRDELTYAESARIVAQVAETLHRAHLKGLFHRDVKLANILLSEDGEIFLSDFGLCVSEREQLKEGRSTTGTCAYMAPEQIRGESHLLDGRADIYALGVVLYRLLTGRLPFIADTQAEYLDLALRREPRPPRSVKDDIPAELERICLKCLNKDIKDRYTTAADLAKDLRDIQTTRPAQVQHRRLHPVRIVTAAALIILLMVLIWSRDWVGSQTDPVSPPPPKVESGNHLAYAQVVAWTPIKAHESYAFIPAENRYVFETSWDALFKADTQKRDDITLRMVFGLKDWEGMAGVFWSLKTTPDDIYKCWAVQFGQQKGQTFAHVAICEITLRRTTADFLRADKRILSWFPAPRPTTDRATLRVAATDSVINQIWLNGQAQLKAPYELRDVDGDAGPGAGVGFGGELCTASVYEFSVE